MQSSFWDWQVGAPIRPAPNNNYRRLFNPRFKRFLNECCIDDLRGRVCSRPRQTPEALRGLLRNSVDEYVFTVSVARIVLWVRSIRPRHRRMFGFGIDVHENTIHKDAIW